jgi:hypothetical protein
VADQTSESIDIAAASDDILAVIADFPAYPEWVDSIAAAAVLTTRDGRPETVRMALDHPLVKDEYVLRFDWSPALVSWQLVRGKLVKALEGSYRLTRSGERTNVTYSLRVDLILPVIGTFKRKAEKAIVGGALSGLKKRVEG